MNDQDKKYQNIETQYAILMAICNFLVFAAITIAGFGMYLLFNRLSEFYAALKLLAIY